MTRPRETGESVPDLGVFQIDEWSIRQAEGTLWSHGRSVRLEPRVMDLLVYLAAHPGRMVPKEELLSAVWRGAFVEEGALSQAVHSLRKVLGDDARQPRYIETIPKRGYRLIAPVIPMEHLNEAEVAGKRKPARDLRFLRIIRNDFQVPDSTRPAVLGGGAVPPALHQLPSPPVDFTGREEDLAALRSALGQGGTGAIFGLRGMGGVGKTTLALKLAEELAPLYPDAQLFLNLKGFDPQPLTAFQAMAHVIRSYYPDASLPENETQLAALYRSVLHRKKTLLLMDNAATREQVEPLIPPSGSLLLVTSRRRFVLPGLVHRDLDEMPEADACRLLLKVAPRIGKEAGEIARLCGWLPLALRLAGSTLAERPDFFPSDYASRLKEGKGLDPVEASLALSYELLSDEKQRLWRMLSVFPGTFTVLAAAAVWGEKKGSAEDMLGDLVGCSLVEWRVKEERYRLHDLARQFGDHRLQTDERDRVRRRHAKFFLEVLREANRLYREGGEPLRLGLNLFDREWINIQTGQSWTAAHFREDEEAARICDDYPDAGGSLLELRQHPREQIRWREIALMAARQSQNRVGEGSHVGSLGIAFAALGELRHAIELYEQQLAIAREIGDRRREGSALGYLGIAYKNLGEPRRAIELYEQRLAIAREIGDRYGEGNAFGNLGIAYTVLADTPRAIEFHEQHLAIAREIGDRRGEEQALGNLGYAYAATDDTRLVLEFFEQAYVIAREIGDRHGEEKILDNIGIAYAALGETRQAIKFHEHAVSIAREVGDRRGEGTALGNLANAYADLGEIRRAFELYEQRLAIAHEIGDRQGKAEDGWHLGQILEQLGDIAHAVELMQVLVDYQREIGHPDAEKHAAEVEVLRVRLAKQTS